jgi:diacylglycerol kinase family enzyme
VQVDVGRIHFTRADGGGDRRLFVNSASVGVSLRANRIAARFRALLPGRACYSLGGVVALLAESAGSYTVESGDGTPRPVRALNLTVANGACFGGGMRISPGSSPVDGILEQVTIGDIGRLAALRALSRLYAGTHIGMPGITVATLAGPLRITRSDGSMVVETDGENLEVVGAIAIEALPGALRLL